MDIREKLSLIKKANGLAQELGGSKDLPIRDKLALIKERNAVIAQLKGTSQKTPEEPSNSKVVDFITLEQFEKLDNLDKYKKLDTVLYYSNWYEYEQKIFPQYKVVDKGSNWVLFKTNHGFSFGYKGHISRDLKYWEKNAGSNSANGGFGSWSRGDRAKAIKAIKQAEDGTINLDSYDGSALDVIEYTKPDPSSGLDAIQIAVKPKHIKDFSIDNLLLIAKSFDSKANISNGYIEMGAYQLNEMAESKSFKLDVSSISQDGQEVFSESVIESKNLSAEQENPLLEQYREGEFNHLSPAEFRDIMSQVDELGLAVNEVGEGMLNWFKANPDKLAA